MKRNGGNIIPIGVAVTSVIVLSIIVAGCSGASTPAVSSPPAVITTTTEITAVPSTTTNQSSQFQHRGTSGTLADINGDTMIVTTQQGQVTVNLSSETTLEKTVVGDVNDLSQGDFVTISGIADSSGNLSATSIMVRPQVQQGQTPSTIGNGGGFTGPNGGSPGGNSSRQFTIGTIISIDNNSLTVMTTQGQATVNIGPDTVIENTITGTTSDLQTGVFLTVVGTTDSNGDVTATSISIRPQGQGFPGGVPTTTAS